MSTLAIIGAVAAGAGALGSLGMGISGKVKGNKNARIEARSIRKKQTTSC